MPLALRHHPGGVWVLLVHVTPKSGKNQFCPMLATESELKLKVTAAPDKGAANSAVIALLSEGLGLPKSSFAIRRGETARHKQVSVTTSWTLADWQARLHTLTGLSPEAIVCDGM